MLGVMPYRFASGTVLTELFSYPWDSVNPSVLLVDLLNAIQEWLVLVPALAAAVRANDCRMTSTS